jgi:hypothetical protein
MILETVVEVLLKRVVSNGSVRKKERKAHTSKIVVAFSGLQPSDDVHR